MTKVEFHHNAPDKFAAAARLIGAAVANGARVLVFAPQRDVAQRIDQVLWTYAALSFVPHVAADSPLAQETPVLIAGSLEHPAAAGHDQVLVNLDGELPPAFARFERLIEIVGSDDADRLPARSRFRFYRDRGYPLTTNDLSIN
ncbi:MAG: DNA polymerase III subunit chi [Sterolibacteriaceae bacterium]|uniref:DNA polymerase III subunit chi n=1 Tax=Candidatus Methylophosphatis roskildensis TaxID=2899263 RepID=A0A9D7ECJ4_9PROT|nr:DNA polymerase III subunit chi [Candidatus Methylophosphatis roskildensis]MBK7237167.1 DNA polymerase III subunit chi [Sterolibacteriaceae bacterium]